MLVAGFVFLAVASLVFGVATTLKKRLRAVSGDGGKGLGREELVIEQGPSIRRFEKPGHRQRRLV